MIPSREEDLLKAVIENAIDGVIVIKNTGEIILINDAACHLFGYQISEVRGKNVRMLMDDPDRSAHDSYIHRYQQSGKPRVIGIGREVEGLKKSGDKFPFRLAISEIKSEKETLFTGFIHDLTREKQAEAQLKRHADELEEQVEKRTRDLQKSNILLQKEVEERTTIEQMLRESQHLYTEIAKNFPNGVINVFDRNLHYIFANGKGLSDAGIDPAKLIGTSFLERLNPEAREIAEYQLNKVLEGELRSFEINHHQQYYILRGVPLRDNQQQIDRILVVETNITPQKQAEVEIFRSLQKEKELNEMKSRFVSMASHEFRTPLSTILSSAALISRYTETGQQENRMKHIDRIKSNVHNLNMILQDFLSLEKLDEGKLVSHAEPFNLCEFLNEVAEDIEGILKPGQMMEVSCKDESLQVNQDKHLFQNVLYNLLSNASKYSDSGTKIKLRVLCDNHTLHLEIEDQGMGIPESDQASIFTRFFRAGNAGNIQGTGLGLHIVKNYVDLMGGQINFKSFAGVGTTFTLIFDKSIV